MNIHNERGNQMQEMDMKNHMFCLPLQGKFTELSKKFEFPK